MKVFRHTAMLALAALAACSPRDSAQIATPDTQRGSPGATPATEPTANDISDYRLDMEKMKKYSIAIRGFATLAKTDSAAADAMSSNANATTAQMIARLENNPAAMGVLHEAGLTAQEYVWITAAWLQAAMTQGVLESSSDAKIPEGQNPQNLEFLKAHKAELEAMTRDVGTAQE
jgi:hypothetical protein